MKGKLVFENHEWQLECSDTHAYGQSDFVTFKVNKFNLPMEKTSKDKFMELFYVGK